MGILDDAIKDHLDLKRRRGTDEPEIRRLEDEAFGPPGRPDASGAADAAIASALASPGTDTAVEERPVPSAAPKVEPQAAAASDTHIADSPAAETAPVPDGPASEEPPAPAPEKEPEAEPADTSAESGGGIAFHDFAAEEGLVAPSDPSLENPFVEEAAAQVGEPSAAEVAEPPADESSDDAPPPGAEDTQVHDMAQELGLDDEAPAPSESDASTADEALGELELEELDLELEDDEIELPLGGEDEAASPNGSVEPPDDEPEPEALAEVVEESEELETVEPEGAKDSGADDDEDVLEDTPEFLRDAPESDRLWFEQGKPKDFDFDDEDE